MSKKKVRVLALISGGLDSMLAAKLLLEEGIEVVGLVFKSAFFGEERGKAACRQLGIECRVIDFSEEHLEMVKRPPHGWGSAVNPCVDCHLLMLKKAREILEREGFDLVITGEVLGERPFSQNRRALELIAKESGLGERLLRPLSAGILGGGLAEKKGWVSKKALLAISGRQRKEQMRLARKLGLRFPQPGGGCVLTEKGYGQKLKKMFRLWPKCGVEEVRLLRMGRVFWERDNLIVVGRDKEENERLEAVKRQGDVLIKPKNFVGPSALVRRLSGKVEAAAVERAKQLVKRYAGRKAEGIKPLKFETL